MVETTTWREDNTKLLQKMLRDKVERKTGDRLLDKGLCPLCGTQMVIKQEGYATNFSCLKSGCPVSKIRVEYG